MQLSNSEKQPNSAVEVLKVSLLVLLLPPSLFLLLFRYAALYALTTKSISKLRVVRISPVGPLRYRSGI